MLRCPVCSRQWDGERESCSLCEFPISQFKSLLSGELVLGNRELEQEYKEAIDRAFANFLSSTIVLSVCLGHSMCRLSIVCIRNDSFEVLEPIAVLSSSDFFEMRGFDFLTFVISLFYSNIGPAKVDGVAMSIPCPVEYAGESVFLHPHWSGWPEDFIGALRRRLGCEKVAILNDAVAFALGCFHEQQVNDLQFPILCLTLGTGIGCAILQKEGEDLRVKPFELFRIRRWWPVGFEGDPHELAGAPFFSYVRHYTDWDVEETKHQFSIRIVLIIREIEKELNFNSVLLGGGRVRFANADEISENLSKQVRIMDRPELSLRGAAYGWALHFLWGRKLYEVIENP
jgi:hypothetical protein